MGNITRTMIVNDLHIPWHDPRAVDLCLDIAEDSNTDRIVLNGDVLDFYNLSNHGPKHPDIQHILEDELYEGLEFLKNLRKRFKKQHIVFLFGNHEFRLDRYTMRNAPAYWNIVSLEKQLQLEHLNIEWHEYNHCYRLEKSNLFIQHSPPSYAENLAMTSLKKKSDRSFIFGCSHRRDYACIKGHHGIYEVWANGWLGSQTLSRQHGIVFSFTKGHENWHHSVSFADVLDEKHLIDVHHLAIKEIGKKYLVSFNGFVYEG